MPQNPDIKVIHPQARKLLIDGSVGSFARCIESEAACAEVRAPLGSYDDLLPWHPLDSLA